MTWYQSSPACPTAQPDWLEADGVQRQGQVLSSRAVFINPAGARIGSRARVGDSFERLKRFWRRSSHDAHPGRVLVGVLLQALLANSAMLSMASAARGSDYPNFPSRSRRTS